MRKNVLRMFAAVVTTVLMATVASAGPPAGKAPKATPEVLEKGKQLFGTYCVACHGEKGDGSGPAGQVLNPKPRNFATDPFKQGNKTQDVFATLSTGVAGTPMVAFGHLSEEDRWALTHYVLTFVPKGGKKGR